MDDFIVSGNFQGYVYVGHAQGNFDTDRTELIGGKPVPVKQPYFNMYVISPVSSYVSEDYSAVGFKAEKLKCVSADVWRDIQIGEQVQLFFDDKKRVQMAASVAALSAALKMPPSNSTSAEEKPDKPAK